MKFIFVMVRYIFALLILFLFFSCNEEETQSVEPSEFLSEYANSKKVAPEDFTSLEWKQPHIDLGKMVRGGDKDIEFPFKNTGDKPLIIDSVIVTCGCTLFNIPKEPIKPGKKVKIMVRFVSKDLPLAMMERHVYVKANTTGSPYHTLSFKLELVDK